MSDQWGTTEQGEPNASGTGGFNPPSGPVGGTINISVPGFDKLASGIGEVVSQLNELKSVMAGFNQNQHTMGQGLVNTFQNVQSNAAGASDAVKQFFTTLSGARPAGTALGTMVNYGLESGMAQDLAMFPLRYLQSTIGQNRQFALSTGGALAGQQFATGQPTTSVSNPYGGTSRSGLFASIGGTYGAATTGLPTGSAEEITQFLQIARQAGAMAPLETMGRTGGWGTGGNPRAPGFSFSAYQMQQMYPGMPLGQIGQTLGNFVANSGAQRQSVMLTGGAFSMIKGGGQMKSIDEWAESILRWLEGQRPGGKRGQGFTYDELLSQQYPGSNISAWFDANDVPADMQEVWWNYALAKSRKGTTTGASLDIRAAAGAAQGATPNPALSRLLSTQPMTQTSFNLAQSMGGVYAQREDANRIFNRTVGAGMQTIIPAAINGPLGFMRAMPDSVEEFLMSILERTGVLGSAVGGALGWGGLAAGGIGSLLENLFDPNGLLFQGLEASMPGGITDAMKEALAKIMESFGDVGDIGDTGDWGTMGGTSPSALHPSMNSKVSAMMKANPRLRMNSGRRDEVKQRKLKAGGYSRVSGKSSAHTRGLAADMGPASEYGWLMANARKFGLQSGAKAGEPWHVGMPGIGDDGTTGLGGLLGLLGGSGANPMDTLNASLPALFALLFGQFGTADVAGKATASDIQKNLAYDPEYSKKLFAAGNYTLGGKFGGDNSVFTKILAAAQAKADVTYGKATADTQTHGGSGSESLVGALQALGISSTGLSDGAMVALLANKAGWTGDNLVKAVSIAGRESSFVPTAHRTDQDPAKMSGDRGLWQINAKAWTSWLVSHGYQTSQTDRSIFDPWVNAQAAHGIWAESGFSPWSLDAAGHSGGPFTNTNQNEAVGYVKEAGLSPIGDVDGWSGGGGSGVRIGPQSTFHNTFVIQGGGGNGGIDTRRVVSQIADQLEAEMNRRQARAN